MRISKGPTTFALVVVALSMSSVSSAVLAQSSQLRPEPPLPKQGPYSCSPQYFAEQISKAKAAVEVSDWSMATVIRSDGEGASECADKYKHPHYEILKAYFYLQAARLDMRESPPDVQEATVLNNAAKEALNNAAAYDLGASDLKLLNAVQSLAYQTFAESSGEVAGEPGSSDITEHPIIIDSCAVQPLIENNSLLPSATSVDVGITFHATTQPVAMVEFLFWFQDSFGDRQGAAYSGISSGTFSPGIAIAPRRGLVGYLGRSLVHPNEAVWPLYSGGKTGSAECMVYKARLASGEVWTDHRYDSTFPIQLP
jgi:hypothetical protein